MQRLPYNGARRAHKLRHNVTSSSLSNERWQRALRTRSYPGVFVVRLSFSLSRYSALEYPSSIPGPTINAVRHRVLPENLLRAARCVVKSVSNVIHLLTEAEPAVSTPQIVFRGSRYHFLGALPRYRALPIIISLLSARYGSPVTAAAFVRAITRPDIDLFGLPHHCAISCTGILLRDTLACPRTRSSRNHLGADLPLSRCDDIDNFDFSHLSNSHFRSKLHARFRTNALRRDSVPVVLSAME